jgi:hypothetical protein
MSRERPLGARTSRVVVNVTPELAAILERLAEAQDKSLSSSTSDILEEAAPNLLRLAKIAETFKKKRQEMVGRTSPKAT